MSRTPQTSLEALVSEIAAEIEAARGQVRQAVNSAMVQSYWQIRRMIVEHEQAGESRAVYGKQQLQVLSLQLAERLGWTHYRRLLRIENEQARTWYLQEVISQSWSARALDRQIGKLYYERLLASQDK